MEKIRLPQRVMLEERFFLGLTSKQCIYMIAGLGGVYLTCQIGLPLQIKAMVCGSSIGGSYALATTTINKQTIEKFLLNVVKYFFVRKNFGGIKDVETHTKSNKLSVYRQQFN